MMRFLINDIILNINIYLIGKDHDSLGDNILELSQVRPCAPNYYFS